MFTSNTSTLKLGKMTTDATPHAKFITQHEPLSKLTNSNLSFQQKTDYICVDDLPDDSRVSLGENEIEHCPLGFSRSI
jgi:hypothetical protein